MKYRTIQISPEQYEKIIKLKKEQGRSIKGQLECILRFYFNNEKLNEKGA